jgi:transcriptional regulator with XRE-family HTH domain
MLLDVNNSDRAKAYQDAVLAQLNAEIAAHDHTIRSLAVAMDIDYNTLRRYMLGERSIPMTTLWAVLGTLEVEEGTFMARAKERFQSNS